MWSEQGQGERGSPCEQINFDCELYVICRGAAAVHVYGGTSGNNIGLS